MLFHIIRQHCNKYKCTVHPPHGQTLWCNTIFLRSILSIPSTNHREALTAAKQERVETNGSDISHMLKGYMIREWYHCRLKPRQAWSFILMESTYSMSTSCTCPFITGFPLWICLEWCSHFHIYITIIILLLELQLQWMPSVMCVCVCTCMPVCVHFSVAGGFAWEWAVALLSDSALMRSGNSSAIEGEKSSKKLIPPTADQG